MVPYAQLDTIFLDVGNTLISMDFDWVCEELALRHIACTAEELRRAEAAARPGYAQRLVSEAMPKGTDFFRLHMLAMFARLDVTSHLDEKSLDALFAELRPVLRPDDKASAIWKSVMPYVPEALTCLRQLGLTLVVVSNSDGTAERSLVTAGLRPFFAAVIDSKLVGAEKPDARIFHAALKASGAHPERTLHVGDLYHMDVIGARQAGIHAVMLDPYDDWATKVTDVDRVRDLYTLSGRIASACSATSL